MSLIRVMTFNILYTWLRQTLHFSEIWSNRSTYNVEIIRRFRPHVIGFQEFDAGHWQVYKDQLADYDQYVANVSGELLSTPIFWNREKFDLVKSGMFWLSESPDEKSISWEADAPRTASWVMLTCRESGSDLIYINTHFDWKSELARQRSSEMILERLNEIQGNENLLIVLGGDFNCNPWSASYRVFLDNGFVDAYRSAGHGDSAESYTFHGFQGDRYFALDWGNQVMWRIDWILVRYAPNTVQVASCTIVRDADPPVFASDHYPVVAELYLYRY